MDCPRVCVIDHSPAIRETIAIVLGEGYRVDGLTPDDCLRDPDSLRESDLLIIADDALPPEAIGVLRSGPPILWLRQASAPIAVGTDRWAALPRTFTPEELRARVRETLSQPGLPRSATSPLSIVNYPLIPTQAAELAHHAARTKFPVLICGEAGTGKARLARAIHTLGREGRFVPLSATGCNRAALEQAAGIAAGDLTVFLNDLSALTSDGQALLVELLDCGGFESSLGWHRARLICATAQTLEVLARSPHLARDLYYRLGVLPITLPPLRERTTDIARLAEHVASELARVLDAAPVSFTPRALERLTRYLWFGNLAELETVLTRTVALTPHRPIDADHLLFGYGRVTPRARYEHRVDGTAAAAKLGAEQNVDLIINELAHEFKNPMVTIKMVAQQLERLLADQTSREHAARLTGDAVDRMDRTLENLLQFTRFRAPAAHDIAVSALLAPCLTDLAPQLSERRVVLNYQGGASFPVFVDAAQIAYALDNLLHAIVRDLQEGDRLSISIRATPPVLTFAPVKFGRSFATQLSGVVDHPGNGGGAPLPLGLVFAKALVERNGGSMEFAADTSAITVRLPNRGEVASANGKATDPTS